MSDEVPNEIPNEIPVEPVVEQPKKKPKAKAKPRVKKPGENVQFEAANVVSFDMKESRKQQTALKQATTGTPQAATPQVVQRAVEPRTPVQHPVANPAFPSQEQILMYLQNQKMLKAQRKQSKLSQLVSHAF